MLDGDAASNAEEICARLRRVMPAVNVPLPPDVDPADLDQEQLFDLIARAELDQGVDLFSFPKSNP
jgi:hypothetical protein